MAIDTRDDVIRRLQDELKRIQTEENAPRRQFIHTRTNGTFNEAEVLTGDRTRAVAAVGAAGMLLTLMVVVGWDRSRASRPRRTRAERKSAGKGTRRHDGDTTPEGDDEAGSDAVTTVEVEHDERKHAEPVPTKGSAADTDGEADPEDHPPGRTLVTRMSWCRVAG